MRDLKGAAQLAGLLLAVVLLLASEVTVEAVQLIA